jgi:hypothetical protein
MNRTHTATVVHHSFGSGAASVDRIANGLRTGAIKTQPQAAQPRQPLTRDPYLLSDGVPVLRMVGSKQARTAPEPVPFVAFQRPFGVNCCHTGQCGDMGCEGHPCNQGSALEDRNDVDPVLRRRVWIALTAWCAGWAAFALYLLIA